MKKLAIFDLDGTLLNTLESIAFCGNTALKGYGLPTVDISKYPDFIGNGAPWLIEQLYNYVGADRKKFPEFLSYALEVYSKYGSENITVFNGIYEMLDILKNANIKCAVLSNKPHKITVEASKKFFGDRFEYVYGHRDGIAKKPDPYMVNEIMQKLSISCEQCIYCGDSSVDVETGKNAGVTMLGAAWGFYGDKPFERADGILYHPKDIIRYI